MYSLDNHNGFRFGAAIDLDKCERVSSSDRVYFSIFSTSRTPEWIEPNIMA